MRLGRRVFIIAVGLLSATRAIEASADSEKFLVVRAQKARYKGPDIPGLGWTKEEAEAFRPPFGRVLRGFEKNSEANGTAYWDILIDNGEGLSTGGRVDAQDVAVFETQGEAEDFARKLAGRASHLEPVLERVRVEDGGDPDYHSGRIPPKSTTPAEPENFAPSRPVVTKVQNAQEADALFADIRKKLRAQLGSSFLSKLQRGYAPTAADRVKFIAAAEAALTPSERAAFAMIATSWAEERASVSDPQCQGLSKDSPATLKEKCREDLAGRANMLFTMKIIDNRAETRKSNRQYTSRDYWDKSKLERIWGVATKDRAFSSWNAGSRNAGNMMAMMLGEGDDQSESERISLDRAIRAYRDFSSGKAIFQGFEYQNKLATHMLNPSEVKAIRAKMNAGSKGRIVSWSIEDAMGDHKSGTHEVGIRVPSFSITLPEGKVPVSDVGHWPVYLDNVNRKDMERVRMTQGGW
jgi:hypothetical protein